MPYRNAACSKSFTTYPFGCRNKPKNRCFSYARPDHKFDQIIQTIYPNMQVSRHADHYSTCVHYFSVGTRPGQTKYDSSSPNRPFTGVRSEGRADVCRYNEESAGSHFRVRAVRTQRCEKHRRSGDDTRKASTSAFRRYCREWCWW